MSEIETRYSNTLFDDVWLPEETRAVRDEVREFCEREVRPLSHELNNTPESVSAFPRALVGRIAEAGLYRIPFEKKYGGRGLEYPTLATMVVLEEVAYLSSGLAASMIDVQLILFGYTLRNAKETVRAKLFPKLMAGEIIGSFATSEPMASTDLSVKSLQTIATRKPGGYVLNGHKRWITNSPVADYMTVLCKLDDSMVMLLVDLSNKGIKIGGPDKKMGNHCQLTADVQFENVFVPDDHLVGVEGHGLKAALTSLTMGRVGIGAVGVGMAQRAFDFAVDYMKQREVFGKPLSQYQYWQFKFSEHATSIENARNLYVKAAIAEDKKRSSVQQLCAQAKLVGSEITLDVVRDAIQVCGGYGFVKELAHTGKNYPLEAIYRDCKIGEIYEGANEVQKMIIARNIFGR